MISSESRSFDWTKIYLFSPVFPLSSLNFMLILHKMFFPLKYVSDRDRVRQRELLTCYRYKLSGHKIAKWLERIVTIETVIICILWLRFVALIFSFSVEEGEKTKHGLFRFYCLLNFYSNTTGLFHPSPEVHYKTTTPSVSS